MKEMADSIILMLEKGVITPFEAHEIYVQACQEWFKPDIHIHQYSDDDDEKESN